MGQGGHNVRLGRAAAHAGLLLAEKGARGEGVGLALGHRRVVGLGQRHGGQAFLLALKLGHDFETKDGLRGVGRVGAERRDGPAALRVNSQVVAKLGGQAEKATLAPFESRKEIMANVGERKR